MGGCPPGAAREYPGTRAGAEALNSRPVTLPGRLSFAWRSPTWGGGIAFFEPGVAGRVLAHAHLITAEQLGDVLEQEMWRAPGAEHDLSDLMREGRYVLGPGRYETLIRTEDLEGRPVVTFTAADPEALGLRAPAAGYLATMARGLRAAHSLDDEGVVDYLTTCRGLGPGWGRSALLRLVRGC